jgi:hypothetical protein
MKINDNGVDRDMTADEKKAYEAWATVAQIEHEQQLQAAADKAAARQAVLDKLGLTQNEAQALLG